MRFVAISILVAACGDDGVTAPDAPDIDAGPCGADMLFTGGYEDWDSTEQDFLGVFDATVTEVADPTNTAQTAPNGRSTLCIARADGQVTYSKDGYVPARYTVDPDATRVPYELRGISTTRVETFHTDDLGIAAGWDETAALVQVAVVAYPDGGAVDGVAIAVGGATDGVHKDASNTWQPGATTGGSPYVAYPNVPITGGGEVTLSVVWAGGTCVHPETIHVVAGEVAMTTVECQAAP